jgi:uncharacterized protein YqgV (UPF0045/DUF77 family)
LWQADGSAQPTQANGSAHHHEGDRQGGGAGEQQQLHAHQHHDRGNLPRLTIKVIVDLCVVPIGVGVHLAPTIAACEKVLADARLKIQLHPNGTAIEGEWAPINTRTDKDQTLADKVASVQAMLQARASSPGPRACSGLAGNAAPGGRR